MASTLPNSAIFKTLAGHDAAKVAVIHSQSGRAFTYGSLLHDIAATKDVLWERGQKQSLRGERIAFLAENGYDYVVTFLSILAHDAIALPLSHGFPSSEIRYILEDSKAKFFLSTEKFEDKARDVLKEHISLKPKLEVLPKIETGAQSAENVKFRDKDLRHGGFMLYTSGTTNRPKGVVLSTSVLMAQAKSLIEAWNYSQADHLLHVLPLHHIHGTVNALFTPLIAGATIEFAFPFNADLTWKRFAAPFLTPNTTSGIPPITFFTVVPTIYSRLLSSFSSLDDTVQNAAKRSLAPTNLRLNISGSAALPTPIKQAWTELSGGNVLLERYGMTEVGMALSCGLDFADRVDASVGWPLPSVEVRLVDVDSGQVIQPGHEKTVDGRFREGEIQLRGPTIFSEYWQNPTATAEEFVDAEDGQQKWFKTGDVATRQEIQAAGQSGQTWAKGPMYFIRGRKSVDIIKTGGEKVSALEVERELLSLPQVSEAAVVGLDSDQWGQKVAAVIVLSDQGKTAGKGGKPWGAMDMRRALKDRLINYKLPQELKVVESIPRNAMGKINKKALVKELF
ncbi:hypothetical protein LTR64_006277 [Lithohypha guttulata]|uniref:uncharacterized protein n=1 Tax=Lithohypha guttulata TaxID=1690604 RepID=UPI002DE043FF|nr:hypothetical protein LTR51_001925 [Lithohypha guttulata]